MSVVVVGAALLRDGRVLAGRRSAPSDLAGGWEFPGGKVDPGESEPDALIRECREELGVAITVGSRLGGDEPLRPGFVLRVWTATLAPGSREPVPLEDHDELRWLGPDELGSVPWLPADRPYVELLRPLLLTPRLLI